MANDDRISKLEKEIDKIKEIIHSQEILQLKDKTELKELISQAVETGNEKIIKKLEDQDKRIIILENQDGEKAKAVLKSILITSLSWFVLGLLNNLPLFINK